MIAADKAKRVIEQVEKGIISVELLELCYDAVNRHCNYAEQSDCLVCPWTLGDECLGTLLMALLQKMGSDWDRCRFEGTTALEEQAEANYR